MVGNRLRSVHAWWSFLQRQSASVARLMPVDTPVRTISLLTGRNPCPRRDRSDRDHPIPRAGCGEFRFVIVKSLCPVTSGVHSAPVASCPCRNQSVIRPGSRESFPRNHSQPFTTHRGHADFRMASRTQVTACRLLSRNLAERALLMQNGSGVLHSAPLKQNVRDIRL